MNLIIAIAELLKKNLHSEFFILRWSKGLLITLLALLANLKILYSSKLEERRDHSETWSFDWLMSISWILVAHRSTNSMAL